MILFFCKSLHFFLKKRYNLAKRSLRMLTTFFIKGVLLMQAPTPPTKPIPPTPPSMKTSSAAHSTDTQPSITVTPKVASPAKEQQSPAAPNVISQSTNSIPPMTTSGTSNSTSKEITSQTAIPPTTQVPKATSSSFGFSFFFTLIFLVSLTLIAVHWWKNNNRKQQSSVDYSTESSDEIVNLILSQNHPEPTLQVLPKIPQKKITPKAESTSKPKGGFEVRI